MNITIIAAMAKNRVIGVNNSLPAWNIPGDLKRFKELTMGKVMIMGRKTFDSIGRCLPGRWTVVVTASRMPEIHNSQTKPLFVNSLTEAFKQAELLNPGGEIIVAGGGEIYTQALQFANKLELSIFMEDMAGDTFFPVLPEGVWEIAKKESFDNHVFLTMFRKKADLIKEDSSDSDKSYKELGAKIGALVDEKNKAYGSSFDDAGDFLRILYPQGISVSQYGDALALVRIFDKMKRIATDKDAFGESPYADIAGYGLLGLKKSRKTKDNKEAAKSLKKALSYMEKKYS